MDKIMVTTHATFDNTRKLWYKLICLDDENNTLLLTVWGKTETFCNELTIGVMDKMSK